ncbi:MAG: DUF4446 family protein [Clostridiaceae bacterium]|nr:DUF4446 family protein [Clostridiaceae bacterium]
MGEFYGIPLEVILLIAANFIIILIMFIMILSSKRRIRRLNSKYMKFMNGLSGANIEEILYDCIEKTNTIVEKNKELDYQLNTIKRNMYYCVQKVGIVRYNAFDNVGSDLSFSIALLDYNDDGVVISSLYSRDSSSSYAKPVERGKSKHALSAEEIKAIDNAKRTHISNYSV